MFRLTMEAKVVRQFRASYGANWPAKKFKVVKRFYRFIESYMVKAVRSQDELELTETEGRESQLDSSSGKSRLNVQID